MLDFYARRSPIFLAAVFDGSAANERGQKAGDSTPLRVAEDRHAQLKAQAFLVLAEVLSEPGSVKVRALGNHNNGVTLPAVVTIAKFASHLFGVRLGLGPAGWTLVDSI